MQILDITCIDFDHKQTWQIIYNTEFRSEVKAWLFEQGLKSNLSDRLVDENDNIIWLIIYGISIDTILLTRKEDAILARLCWELKSSII